MNENDSYVIDILGRHQSSGSVVIAQNVINTLSSSIITWANGHLYEVYPAGSVAKGTAISESSDIDILISVKTTAVETLKEVYEKLPQLSASRKWDTAVCGLLCLICLTLPLKLLKYETLA